MAERRDEVLVAAAQRVGDEETLVPAVAAGDEDAARRELVEVVERRPERQRERPGDVPKVRSRVREDVLVDAAA